jgi:tetratricopeptide (TPR) repeat protein
MSSDKTRQPQSKAAEIKPTGSTGLATTAKPAVAAPASEPGPVSLGQPVQPPSLFRAIDWIAFGVTTLLVFGAYLYTLAPDLTLQDCGELAVASMYAGVPHPPGYPVWTLYSWLFTLLPISNIAYRVAISSALAGALSCGLIALMVSRGSSMMMEGIAELKNVERRWENVLCLVAGCVAGMLMGFNGFMWSQSVIVEVYTLSILSMAAVLVCVLRWTYAPHQYRYLYLAFFLFGIAFNNHQSLLVIALGLEAAVLAVQPGLARSLFFWNTIVYLGGLIGKEMGMVTVLQDNPPLLRVFHAIGLASAAVWAYLLYATRVQRPRMLVELGGIALVTILAVVVLRVPLVAVCVGLGVLLAVGWTFTQRDPALDLARDLAMVLSLAYLLVLVGTITHYTMFFYYANSTTLKTEQFILFNLVGLGCIGTFAWLTARTVHLGRHWLRALICGGMWGLGAAFYLYMALASMSNPPLNWGYPRTVTGFFHAFTRGQYERIHPTTDLGRFISQVGMYIEGAIEEFNLVYLLLGLLVFVYYRQMQKRERAWVLGLSVTYLCLSLFLLILLNPSPDRQSRDLNKPFFTASHVLIAMGAGYGLALVGASIALHYERVRHWVLRGLVAATALALVGVLGTYTSAQERLMDLFERLALPGGLFQLFGLLGWVAGLIPPFAADSMVRLTVWFGLALAVAGLLMIYLFRSRPHLEWLLVVWGLMPLYPVFSHWADNEQRGHLFGYWFGHDMFTPPFKAPDGTLSYDRNLRQQLMKGPEGHLIYPEMEPHTVLFGGTDPGRFNPTYMIYCESFIPPSKKPHDPVFDRRDVYLITQNALADATYLNYIRAHYNRSTQIDPYFFSELLRGPEEIRMNVETNILARLVLPLDRFVFNLGAQIEKRRRAGSSFFKPEHFLDLAGLVRKLKQRDPHPALASYLWDNLAEDTRRLMDGPADRKLAEALARDLNRLMNNEYEFNRRLPEWREQRATLSNEVASLQARYPQGSRALTKAQKRLEALQQQIAAAEKIVPFYQSNRFATVTLSDHVRRFVAQQPQLASRIRLSRLLLEAAYPQEIAKSPGGVYPDREIRTPSPEDSQRCFQEYLLDAQRRLEHDRLFPNETKQLKPGEDVRIIDNKVQVSGQVAVMSINGLLTKVIFDANPDHEFYVEESFPLDWMYPYLTPYGIIMKINRQPLPQLTEEILQRDRKFWSDYSERLIGNWVREDTPIAELCAFAERVYVNRNYKGFTGDRKFIRDNDAQKAFSKLRSSIAGVYAWRVANAKTPEERHRMYREAEFAFKQAYAFCPYSPEAIFRYVNLLVTFQRYEDALLLARTSRKLDPFNPQLENLVVELSRIRDAQAAAAGAASTPIAELEQRLRANPADLQAALALIGAYQQVGQHDRALHMVDQIVASPAADATLLQFAVQKYYELGQLPKVEQALERWLKVAPDNPEAWFDLAVLQAVHNKPDQAIASLAQALQRNAARLARDPKAPNLYSNALTDTRLGPLRNNPQFQKVLLEHRPPG